MAVSQAEQAHRGLEVLGRPPNPLVSRPDVIRVRCSPWDLNGSYTWRRRGHFFLPLSPDLWGVSTIPTYFLLSTQSLWECHFIFSASYSRVVFLSSFSTRPFSTCIYFHFSLCDLFPLLSPAWWSWGLLNVHRFRAVTEAEELLQEGHRGVFSPSGAEQRPRIICKLKEPGEISDT